MFIRCVWELSVVCNKLSKKFQGSFKRVSAKFQGYIQIVVSRVFQGRLKGVSRVFERRIKGVFGSFIYPSGRRACLSQTKFLDKCKKNKNKLKSALTIKQFLAA